MFNYKVKEARWKLFGQFEGHLAKYRRAFLKFLFAIWTTCVPNIDPKLPRRVVNIESDMDESRLYLDLTNFVGKTLKACVFMDRTEMRFSDYDGTIEFPSGKGG